jgi:hypothetical protein
MTDARHVMKGGVVGRGGSGGGSLWTERLGKIREATGGAWENTVV